MDKDLRMNIFMFTEITRLGRILDPTVDTKLLNYMRKKKPSGNLLRLTKELTAEFINTNFC